MKLEGIATNPFLTQYSFTKQKWGFVVYIITPEIPSSFMGFFSMIPIPYLQNSNFLIWFASPIGLKDY